VRKEDVSMRPVIRDGGADGATRERVTDTRIKPLFMRLKP
jgi:hypothetical protein